MRKKAIRTMIPTLSIGSVEDLAQIPTIELDRVTLDLRASKVEEPGEVEEQMKVAKKPWVRFEVVS